MILVVAATEFEMRSLFQGLSQTTSKVKKLVTGVGPVAATYSVTHHLCQTSEEVQAVVLFGVGGAYIQDEATRQPGLTDICLAEKEVLGDFGIALGDQLEYLPENLTGDLCYKLDQTLLQKGEEILQNLEVEYYKGNFITVNAVSGTSARGNVLRSRWNGLCENMEGAAVAMVCEKFQLPCLELRSISNFVEDRNPSSWQLEAACGRAGQVVAQLINKVLI